MGLFSSFWKKDEEEESSGDECEDEDAVDLSYVGEAAYEVLRKHHNNHHNELWNVTKGKVIGTVHCTPKDAFTRVETHDPPEGHDDWFPEKIGEIVSRTESWCDVLSLSPPDGAFMESFKTALATICQRRKDLAEETGALEENEIIIRMMFGNIVGQPTNCTAIIEELTKDLPDFAGSCIHLWVGSWRKGTSWNHAKIVAVDGKYLWTGGHNFWDPHYLRRDPVCDLSLELEGHGVTADAHLFANAQWGFIMKKQSKSWGQFVNNYIPDQFDLPRKARVTVSEFPTMETRSFLGLSDTASVFPPYYKKKKFFNMRRGPGDDEDNVPIITMGRYGTLLKKARPADDAFIAMIDSAQTIVRFALQDLGPVTVPGTKFALPGMDWPHEYLKAMARVLWEKGVDIEIVLSNPGSIPNSLSPLEANYGLGWECVDVAAEIIKHIQEQFPDASDEDLRRKVEENLRLCMLRCPKGGKTYQSGASLGLHSKHFIIDDKCCYIGSQNLYICDLAEWGVVIDNEEKTIQIKEEFWDPMWSVSYMVDDCKVDEVMDGLNIERGPPPSTLEITKQQIQEALARSAIYPGGESQNKYCDKAEIDYDNDEDDLSEGED